MKPLLQKRIRRQHWINSDNSWIWLAGSAVGLSLMFVVGLFGLVLQQGIAYWWPGALQWWAYITFDNAQIYLAKLFDFCHGGGSHGTLTAPAVGTVVMVLTISIIATIKVFAAIYLHEYAIQDWLTRLVRIIIHNLQGFRLLYMAFLD